MPCRKAPTEGTKFVFFQAGDDIRSIGVTGVQTCALPILESQALGLVEQPQCLGGLLVGDGPAVVQVAPDGVGELPLPRLQVLRLLGPALQTQPYRRG